MKVPKDYKGYVVAIQLARPVYVFSYAAHIRWSIRSEERIALQHAEAPLSSYTAEEISIMVKAGNQDDIERESVMRDAFPGVLVVDVADDSVTFALPVPSNLQGKVHLVHKTVGFENVVGVDVLHEHDFRVDGARAEQRDVPSRIVTP